MSRIDELIAELAPTGVPRRSLGDVGVLIRGNGLQKSDLTEAGVPAIHYGQLHTFYGTWTYATKSFTNATLAKRLRRAQTGDLIIATTSEDDAAVAKATAWLGSDEVAVSGDAYIYRHTLEPRYVAYYFQSEQFSAQKLKHVTGTKVRRISGAALGKILIPVPPVEVQREIARLLDSFAELEAELEGELEAELEARRRQYEFYRDELLALADNAGIREVPLGDLAGTGFFHDGDWVETKDQDPGGDVRLTQLADVGVEIFRDRSNRWMREDQALRLGCTFLEPGDVLIARMPDPLGRACQVPENIGRAVSVVDVAILRSRRADVLPRYIMYAINSYAVARKISSFQTGTTRQRITRTNLGSVPIPLPSLKDQKQIVDILDHLRSSVNNLGVDLSAELEARRKQYHYYRDKLLTFEESVA